MLEIAEIYGEPYVRFKNEVTVKKFEPYKFYAEKAVGWISEFLSQVRFILSEHIV